jgi:hypothetical protein
MQRVEQCRIESIETRFALEGERQSAREDGAGERQAPIPIF